MEINTNNKLPWLESRVKERKVILVIRREKKQNRKYIYKTERDCVWERIIYS